MTGGQGNVNANSMVLLFSELPTAPSCRGVTGKVTTGFLKKSMGGVGENARKHFSQGPAVCRLRLLNGAEV